MAKRMSEHQMEGRAPLTPIAELRIKNFNILKQLVQKDVEITSSSHQGMKRSYYVEDVREMTINIGSGFVPGVRLCNRREDPDAQPMLKYPTDEIEVEDDGTMVRLTLYYSYEPNIRNSFRHFYKKSREDMFITISYKKK
ncbi:MAG TPA: hypothetical protein PKM88_04970 [bacterium]|nr:hypothetical protein [bacterium]